MQPQKALNSQVHVREKNKQGYHTSWFQATLQSNSHQILYDLICKIPKQQQVIEKEIRLVVAKGGGFRERMN